MPKMKSKRALMKRVKITGTGSLKRSQCTRRHNAWAKNHKLKRHHEKAVLVSKSDYKRIRFILGK